MRSALIISATLLAITSAGTIVLTDVFAQAAPDTEGPNRLDELLKQRRDTLARAVQGQTTYYREGICDFEDVLAVQRRFQEAELDAAGSRVERIAVLEKQLETAETAVSLTKTKFANGAGTEVTLLQAQADLLNVKIQLEREQQ